MAVASLALASHLASAYARARTFLDVCQRLIETRRGEMPLERESSILLGVAVRDRLEPTIPRECLHVVHELHAVSRARITNNRAPTYLRVTAIVEIIPVRPAIGRIRR